MEMFPLQNEISIDFFYVKNVAQRLLLVGVFLKELFASLTI